MAIAKSETLDVLGTSIRSDIHWDDHVFNVSKEAAKCLGFLKRCKKYFTPSDLRTIYVTYIRPKMEYNSHLWAGASKSAFDFVDRIQSRAWDDRVASSITSLRHSIVLENAHPDSLNLCHRPRYSEAIPGCPDEATLSLLRPCPTAQHIIAKTHSLLVLAVCGTNIFQISFLNASMFQCLKQG